MYADRRDAGAGAQLSSSRGRRDGGAGAHLPRLKGVVQMRPGARTDVGPPLRFLTSGPSLGFGAWAVGGTGWGAVAAEPERLAAIHRALDRDVEQRELPLCRERRIAFLAYRPLAAGLLSGKYLTPPEFPAADHRCKIYWFQGREFARRRVVVERLGAIAHRLDMPLSALALAWVLAQPGVGIVLAGARGPEQVEQNLAGARPPPPAARAEVDRIVAHAFPSVRATEALKQEASTWGERERFIVQRLDGKTSAELIAALWTDGHATPMVAAQVKVFCDQLAERGLVG